MAYSVRFIAKEPSDRSACVAHFRRRRGYRIDGANIAYETHVYDRPDRFERLVARPARKLPVVIGEVGVIDDENAKMLPEDVEKLWALAERLDVPWLAYTFHHNCPPNLLVTREGTCGVGVDLAPSPWGRMVKARLAHPW